MKARTEGADEEARGGRKRRRAREVAISFIRDEIEETGHDGETPK